MIPFANIELMDIISENSVYGVIWKAKYNEIICAVKMLVLTSGIHYKNQWLNGDMQPIDKSAIIVPLNGFKLERYYKRQPISRPNFIQEAESLDMMCKMGLGPKYYGYSMYQQNGFVIGFIVMELVSGSLANVILNRQLTKTEHKMVDKTIDHMHRIVVHRDLKPENIGVHLDQNGYITKVVILDCNRMQTKADLCKSEFKQLRKQDLSRFKLRCQLAQEKRDAVAKKGSMRADVACLTSRAIVPASELVLKRARKSLWDTRLASHYK